MTKNKKGLFLALEGIDGSGKSTQIKLLSKYLESIGHSVYTTCEPTDSPIGKMIRDIFAGKISADQHVIAALFASDRLHHVLSTDNGLLQFLYNNKTVITDRYYLSSLAYHSAFVDMDWVLLLNQKCREFLKPDAHIYIDISPDTGMSRITSTRESIEMYETLSNQQKVYRNYQVAIDLLKNEELIITVDGMQSPENITLDIIKNLQERAIL